MASRLPVPDNLLLPLPYSPWLLFSLTGGRGTTPSREQDFSLVVVDFLKSFEIIFRNLLNIYSLIIDRTSIKEFRSKK